MPPQMVRSRTLVLNVTQTHLCDTPFCSLSRNSSAIPHKKQARNSFAILSRQVSRDMRSTAAGPLSLMAPKRVPPGSFPQTHLNIIRFAIQSPCFLVLAKANRRQGTAERERQKGSHDCLRHFAVFSDVSRSRARKP